MSSVEKAQETQLYNIQQKTGKTLAELVQIAKNSGLTKHSEIRDLFRNNFGLGYGDANMLAHYARQADEQGGSQAQASTTADALDQIYTGAKADLRPIYDRLMGHIHQFGEFEIATKKGYVSLRRKKQFAMLGPATNTRFEVGINCKTLTAQPRLVEMPSGSMCHFKVNLTQVDEVDAQLIAWLKQAYESAG